MSTSIVSSSGLLSIENWAKKQVMEFFDRVSKYESGRRGASYALGTPKVGLLAFFEPSTRTRISFERAGMDFGLQWVHWDSMQSSLRKGESLRDSFHVLDRYPWGVVVVRHPDAGFAHLVSSWLRCPVLNAGDGQREHPTQALGDAYLLWKLGKRKKWKITFVGDLYRSRVARSVLRLGGILGYELSVLRDGNRETELFAKSFGVSLIAKSSLKKQDVVYGLRSQRERGSLFQVPSVEPEDLGEQTRVMHPGPVVWGEEFSKRIQTECDEKLLLLEQIEAGYEVRRAVFADLLKKKEGRRA